MLGLDLQKTVQVLGSVVTCPKFQTGKVETEDAQIKMARETSYVSELRV